MKYLVPACFLFLLLNGCIKSPTYPIEPQIEFKSVSFSTLNSGTVDTIVFSFTDGDGDIGISPGIGDSCDFCEGLQRGDSGCLNLNSFNVFLIDHRDTCVIPLASANIEPTGKFDDLSGEIAVVVGVNSTKCFTVPEPGCPNDTVVYSIILKDKAGHRSNIVQTTPIVVIGDF